MPNIWLTLLWILGGLVQCSHGSSSSLLAFGSITTAIPSLTYSRFSGNLSSLNEFFTCNNGHPIDRKFRCDNVTQCEDGSDEADCKPLPPKIISWTPEGNVQLFCKNKELRHRRILNLECQFAGHPKPVIKWRKLNGHIPYKCKQKSDGGLGSLECPQFTQWDQGPYSCMAGNFEQAEAQPKIIVKCNDIFPCDGFVVSDTDGVENCLECFCSGKSRECQSIRSKDVTVKLPLSEEIIYKTFGDISGVSYCSVSPDSLKEFSFLKSFGKSIIIPESHSIPNFALQAPDVIIEGGGITLYYLFRHLSHKFTEIKIRFWPGNWHHLNNTTADRIDIMKVLSNVENLYVRCEYEKGKIAQYTKIYVESANVLNDNRSLSYLEKCKCPEGYSGLSCESCSAGFQKKIINKYDFTCERIPCSKGYTGERCDRCDENNGYFKKGNDCVKLVCNKIGTSIVRENQGECICKPNVEGKTCDRCKSGYFYLHEKGCLECWCSGITDQCKSSNLIKTIIFNDSPLSGYNSSERDFWLLPRKFSGNKLNSYGGNIKYTMKDNPIEKKKKLTLSVELLTVNEEALYYTHPSTGLGLNSKSWTVPLKEEFWRKEGNKRVNRGEFLTFLSDVKAFYVESPYSLVTGLSYLEQVMMDAAENLTHNTGLRAEQVEECQCPEGYQGLSCETCSSGYYRHRKNNLTKCIKCNCDNCHPAKGCLGCSKGYYRNNPPDALPSQCEKCPCNGNEEKCYKDYDFNKVICECKPEFTGVYCETRIPKREEPCKFTLSISPCEVNRTIQVDKVKFKCNFSKSEEDWQLGWEKIYENGKKVRIQNFSLEKNMSSVELVLDHGLNQVACFFFDSKQREVGRIISWISPVVITVPAQITSCNYEHIILKEGEGRELICEASGSPTPEVNWYKIVGTNEIKIPSVDGVHSIMSVTKKENGTKYKCVAENFGDKDVCIITLIVKDECETIRLLPEKVNVTEGEKIHLTCKTVPKMAVTWWFNGNLTLGVDNENLTIPNSRVENSGSYICKASKKESKPARVIVRKKLIPFTVVIKNDDTTIEEGDNFITECEVTGSQNPIISWKSPSHKRMNNVLFSGSTFRIISAVIENTGLYECLVFSPEGNDTSRIHITVKEKKETPEVIVKPGSSRLPIENSSYELNCTAIRGRPIPTITWWKKDENGEFKIKAYTSRLRFPMIRTKDSGKYKCQAENEVGQHSAEFVIQVATRPTVEISSFPDSVHLGDSVTGICSAYGQPKPVVKWVTSVPKSEIRSIIGNGTNHSNLMIKFKAEGEGKINVTCVARNWVGVTSKTISISVLITTGSDHYEIVKRVLIGEPYDLVCTKALDEGVSNITWEKKDGFIENPCEIYGGYSFASVQIQHNGTYLCKSNEKIIMTVHLMVVGFALHFNQAPRSYLVLPMKSANYSSEELLLNVYFKPKSEHGLILLQKNHLFGLYLVKGKIEAKFVSGKKIGIQRPQHFSVSLDSKLEMDNWYSIVLLVRKDSVYIELRDNYTKLLNSEIEYIGNIKIDWRLFKDDFFVGGNKDQSGKDPFIKGMSTFNGCISRLIVDKHEYHMTNEGIYSENVQSCKMCYEEPNPCDNKGVCFDAPTQKGFLCVCPPEFQSMCTPSCIGDGCNTSLNLCSVVNPCKNVKNCISRKSHLECQCDQGTYGFTCQKEAKYKFCNDGKHIAELPPDVLRRKSLSESILVRLSFFTKSHSGNILWQGNQENYFSIHINSGTLECIYYNQKVELNVKTRFKLRTGKTYDVTIVRGNGTISMEIDYIKITDTKKFNTNRVIGKVYLGNVPSSIYGSLPVPFQPFNGCIEKIYFDGYGAVDFNNEHILIRETKRIQKTIFE